jgi:hypothetical protein
MFLVNELIKQLYVKDISCTGDRMDNGNNTDDNDDIGIDDGDGNGASCGDFG